MTYVTFRDVQTYVKRNSVPLLPINDENNMVHLFSAPIHPMERKRRMFLATLAGLRHLEAYYDRYFYWLAEAEDESQPTAMLLGGWVYSGPDALFAKAESPVEAYILPFEFDPIRTPRHKIFDVL